MTDPRVLWDISYGLYAICCRDEANERSSGCIINTLMQVTAIPEQMAVSLSKENYTHKLVEKTGRFAVSILSEETDPFVISAMGFSSGEQRDKMAKLATIETPGGIKIPSDNICGWIEFEVFGSADVGTHTIFLARHVASEKLSDKMPMTYKYYHDVIKGKAPKKAPTYQAST